jgi:uncharacterized protein
LATILFYPRAIKCPIGCLYCFEDPSFNNSVLEKYNKHKMAATVEDLVKKFSEKQESVQVILHGGEVLGLPVKDLDFFLSELKKYSDRPDFQTSLGLPLTSEHIRLIKKYNASPGISVDGPSELNRLRGPRDPVANEKFQNTVTENIRKLKDNSINFGCITILSKANASPDKIDSLIKWCVNNTHGGRFNPLFVPSHISGSEIAKYALTPKELTNAFLKLLDATIKYPGFDFRLFEEIKSALIGDFKTSCAFSRCDYLTTTCNTVLPDGNVARCDRCFQDGYYYMSQKPTGSRWKALEQTECKGCRYFVACAGGCPSEGVNGDFRSKTLYCESYFAMFEAVENILRKLFPGIFLTIDIHNYYEEYVLTGKRFNPFVRHDGFFGDTANSMNNNLRLLGWTPERELEENQQRELREETGQKRNKHGFSHMDSNTGCKKCH